MMFQAGRLASFGKSEETLVESLHFSIPARVMRTGNEGHQPRNAMCLGEPPAEGLSAN